MSFDTVLVANRGEIAARIIRSAQRFGYRTVAVYSDADRSALHTELADVAVHIGAAAASESYLSVDRILDAAKRAGAQAIHPGYGFLAENADFAARCEAEGLVFIGPSSEVIRLMGSKRRAKARAQQAGVPCVPGYAGEAQDEATLIAQAEAIGLPLMIKASAGGGGKGLRLVTESGRLAGQILADQIRLARGEAESAFGDGELILERALINPRHVEIQIFADTHENVVHLGERDCSVQRRHQKIIEETPSPAVDGALRERMGEAAVRLARAIGYVGAGTVEFLLAEDGEFYFMEMNTRLQVEHPVTEWITGLDLVRWQLDVAAGHALPMERPKMKSGHAMEARLYAEDPYAGFLPRTGRVEALRWPDAERVRIDHALVEGSDVTADYDPMLAKISVYGRSRDEARRRLLLALEQLELHGVTTNQSFLCRALAHPDFASGRATTALIANNPELSAPPQQSSESLALGALLLAQRNGVEFWRSSGPVRVPVSFTVDEDAHEALVHVEDNGYRVEVGDDTHSMTTTEANGQVTVECDGLKRRAGVSRSASAVSVALNGGTTEFRLVDPSRRSDEAGAEGGLRAPMSGKVVDVLVGPGQSIQKNQILIVLEAMKMQLELTARADGVVDCVEVSPGDQVEARQLLLSSTVGEDS